LHENDTKNVSIDAFLYGILKAVLVWVPLMPLQIGRLREQSVEHNSISDLLLISFQHPPNHHLVK